MILNFTEVVDRVSNADDILIVYNSRDPGSYSAASALKLLDRYPKKVSLSDARHSGLSSDFNVNIDKYDLTLFVGIHRILHKYLYRDDTLKIDDSFSFEDLSDNNSVYIVNSKNYGKSQTLSHAHFAYELLKEFEIETNKALDLLLMVGDRDDNRELGMTMFQSQLLEKNFGGKLEEGVNLVSSLGKYKLFNFPTFLIFFDYLEHVGFKYTTKKKPFGEVTNKLNVNQLIEEFNLSQTKLVDKLETIFNTQNVVTRISSITDNYVSSYELINAPKYDSMTLDEMLIGLESFIYKRGNVRKPLNISFWSRSNLWGYTQRSVKRLKGVIERDLRKYNKTRLILREGPVNLFGFESTGKIGSKWNWLPFFNWNSFLVEYIHEYNKTEFMLYSKSNLHSGAVAHLSARLNSRTGNSGKGYGNGEFFKGSFFRIGNSSLQDVYFVIDDITTFKKKYLNSVDNNLRYHSVVEGKCYAILINELGNSEHSRKMDVYLPNHGLIADVNPTEFFELSKHYDFEVFDLTK